MSTTDTQTTRSLPMVHEQAEHGRRTPASHNTSTGSYRGGRRCPRHVRPPSSHRRENLSLHTTHLGSLSSRACHTITSASFHASRRYAKVIWRRSTRRERSHRACLAQTSAKDPCQDSALGRIDRLLPMGDVIPFAKGITSTVGQPRCIMKNTVLFLRVDGS